MTAGCGSGGCCSPRGGGGDQCCQIGQHYFPTISSHSRIHARLVLGALFLEDLWGFFYTLSRFPSLAPPAKVLQLNLNSPSVLRLGLRYVSRFSPSKCCASDQREEGVAESYDVSARCLVCLQPARNVIPGQTLAIVYGRSRVALGKSNRFKLQTPAFK